MNETKFIDGLYVNDAKPDFIPCKLSIQADRFCEFVQANKNDKGYVNIDVCRSKEGKLYAKLNDFVPAQQAQQDAPQQPVQQDAPQQPGFVAPPMPNSLNEDIPF